MKFGVREICDVVFKAKAKQTLGDRVFYKDEPVIYFDSLKTSTVEGQATTVYAQGGAGNSRLIAWEGERTVTFTMEDALISPLGLMILTGAGLVEGGEKKKILVHTTDTIELEAGTGAPPAGSDKAIYDSTAKTVKIPVSTDEAVSTDANAKIVYVFPLKNGEIFTEPFYGTAADNIVTIDGSKETDGYKAVDIAEFAKADAVFIDYYTEKGKGAQQIEITADKFAGNYYVEASTLFRNTDGVDLPAEFIIPNAKIQSNFTFTMASSGDPSTFTFTMDAFPDYTKFDKTKKVLVAIQVIGGSDTEEAPKRKQTDNDTSVDN